MKLRTVVRLLGALLFLGTCVLCIPGIYESFLNYWNSKGVWGSIFQIGLQLGAMSVAITGGFILPFAEANQWRTKEEKREVWITLSTSLNLGLIPALVICVAWYERWEHRQDNNILLAFFWLTILFTSAINMMRSKSTRQFQGLRLVKSE